MTTNNKRAIIFGSTGLVGKHITCQLLKNPDYEHVTTVTRTPQTIESYISNKRSTESKLFTNYTIDFETTLFNNHITNHITQTDLLHIFSEHTELYICLGSTMKIAKTRENFKRVDQDYIVQIAMLAQQAGIVKVGLISAIGSSTNSLFFYSRIKGHVEMTLSALNFKQLEICQPSTILGKRKNFRALESLSYLILIPFSLLMSGSLAKYRPVKAETIAQSLIKHMAMETIGIRRIHFHT